MKLLIALLFITTTTYAQSLKENKVDEFTKAMVKRTSWEPVCKGKQLFVSARVANVDGKIYLDLKFMISGGMAVSDRVFSVPKGESVMLKLDNDSIVSLYNDEHKISCLGCGAPGFIGSQAEGAEVNITLTTETAGLLKGHSIIKIRLYTSENYIENDIKDKFAEVIRKELELVM